MTDNTSPLSTSAASARGSDYTRLALEAVHAADNADKERDFRCFDESARRCWVLTFDKLTIQPKVLIHAANLHPDFKFSLNSMAT